jgi:hypothetical protein
VQPDWDVYLDGELLFVRQSQAKETQRVAVGRARAATVDDIRFQLKESLEFMEMTRSNDEWHVVAGSPEGVRLFPDSTR